MAARIGWLLLLIGGCGYAADGNDFYPARTGMRLTYVATSSLSVTDSLRWELSFQKSTEVPPDAAQITVRVSAGRLDPTGRPLTREERYVADQRGMYTLDPDVADAGYGPRPLLPAPDRLGSVDTVWSYKGFRWRPMALGLFNMLGPPGVPAATEGHYHVLAVAPLTTQAGTFKGAVQVAGVEAFDAPIDADHSLRMLLRCRRWYVRGVGLVREQFEFLDYPGLGLTTTELVAYTGVAELPTAPQHVAEAAGQKSG
ncbi:MAG: hypothetical protein HYU66_13665 [Armatimonadetes bacterium]|nr:hypothetical protein [Armatimonadota bacterium]